MEKFLTVAQVIAPIFAAIVLGALARRKKIMSPEEIKGFQQFVMNFGLPCVVFNSCLTANMGRESLTSMALVLAAGLVCTLWSFHARKKKFPYWNLPMLFSAQETGMMGIPLFVILFGTAEAYRMGVLDLTQAVMAYPVIAILTADTGENPSPWEIVKKVFASPLLIMCLLGLGLNLTGLGRWLDNIGVGPVITQSTAFLGQPISAMMIFSVGYNFSLEASRRRQILTISAVHLAFTAGFGILMQLILLLIPGVDAATRWCLVLYCALPASYLAPSLGKTEEEGAVASGVCSMLTIVTLVVFCVMAAFLA